MAELIEGYTCMCGKFHKYPGYVYAHWTIELTHTCDCGKKWKIYEGCVEELEDES